MRAVNLIPDEGGGAGGGIGAYVVLGVLALALAGTVAYVLTSNTIVERRAEAASMRTQAQAAQAQAAAARPYLEFAALAEARVETVRALGRARFDWRRAFDDLSRVMPENVWLTSLLATVAPGVSVDGAGSGTTSGMRGALPHPAIEMTGCTTGQREVARLISRLRLMTDVVRVSLADSVKIEARAPASGQSAGGGDASDCRYGDVRFPQFGVVVFFATPPAVPKDSAPSGGTAAPQPAAVAGGGDEAPAPIATDGSGGSDVR